MELNAPNEAPLCPKCGGEMERGELWSEHALAFHPSSLWEFAFPQRVRIDHANACVPCGHVEFCLDAALLRGILKQK